MYFIDGDYFVFEIKPWLFPKPKKTEHISIKPYNEPTFVQEYIACPAC